VAAEILSTFGGTNASPVLTNVQDQQRGDYSVAVFNPAGQVVSATAFLDGNIGDLSVHRSLVATGSVWKYLDTGADPALPGLISFDDSAWPSAKPSLVMAISMRRP